MKKIAIVISILLSLIFVFSACKKNAPPETTTQPLEESSNIDNGSDTDASTSPSAEEQKTNNANLDGDGNSEDPEIVNIDDNLTNTPRTATVSLNNTYLFHQDGVMMKYDSYGYGIGTMYQMSINVLNDSGSDIVAEVENLDYPNSKNITVKNKRDGMVLINLFDINEDISSIKLRFSWRKADETEMSHTSTVTLTLNDFFAPTLEKYNKNGIAIGEIGATIDEKESVVYLMLLSSDKTCEITISNIVYTSAAGEKNAAGKEITINVEAGKKYTVPIVLYSKMIKNEIVGHVSFDIYDGTTTETYSEDIDTGIF